MSNGAATAFHAPLLLRRLSGAPEEMHALQAVLEAAPQYFEMVSGSPPGPSEAQSLYTALPPGKSYDDKVVWGLYAPSHGGPKPGRESFGTPSGDPMIGCADVIRGWNAPHKAIIGLLLLGEPWQRRGLGTAFARLVEQAITAWPEITVLRIGVVRRNAAARAFWQRLGYRATGETKPAVPPLVDVIDVLEKPLDRS